MSIVFMLPELLRNLFRKPETSQYPFAESKPQDGFRGYPDLITGKCIGCKRCVIDCPAEAIEIIQIGGFDNPKERKFKMKLYEDRCIRCGQCVYSCPVKALEMNQKFETARFDRAGYQREQE